MITCTCYGDAAQCGFCHDFERWDGDLTDAERGELALEFLDSLNTVCGVVRGEINDRTPWFGRVATVEYNASQAFRDYCVTRFAATYRAVAA